MKTACTIVSCLLVVVIAAAAAAGVAAQSPAPEGSSADRGLTPIDGLDRIDPSRVEAAVYQRIAAQPGLELTDLSSVSCDTLRCRVTFSGPDVNPRYVDGYTGLMKAIMDPPWEAYRVTQGSLGRQEIAPGAREFVIEFTYIALVEVSDDPLIRARQHAACAGAWSRVTKLRGSDSYMRTAHEQAAKHLDIAAAQMGLDEAQRLAEALQLGPLARDCPAMPY